MDDTRRSAFSKSSREDPGSENTAVISGSSSRIYQPDAADTSSLPDNIKVDLDTSLESAFWAIMGLAAFAAFFLYIQGTLGGKKSPPNPALLKYVPMMLGVVVLAFISRLGTDNYYIINIPKRKIFYHFKFFFEVKITPVVDFENISAIGVTGVRHTHKGSVWWKYKICVVKNDGELIDFSNESDPGRLEELNRKAKGMASVAGCLFAEGAAQSKLVTANGNSGSRMLSFETDDQVQPQLKDIKLSFTFFVVVALIIVSFCVMMFVLLTPPM